MTLYRTQRSGCPANQNSSSAAHCFHSPSENQTYKGIHCRVCCYCGQKESALHGPYYPGKIPPPNQVRTMSKDNDTTTQDWCNYVGSDKGEP